MENLTFVNKTSKIEHSITFSTRPASPGKIVIKQDGRPVGKINIKSKAVFADNEDLAKVVLENVDSIISSAK